MEYLPIALLLVLLTVGVPVAYSLVLAGVIGITMVSDWSAAFSMMSMLPHRIIATYVLISIPMLSSLKPSWVKDAMMVCMRSDARWSGSTYASP